MIELDQCRRAAFQISAFNRFQCDPQAFPLYVGHTLPISGTGSMGGAFIRSILITILVTRSKLC